MLPKRNCPALDIPRRPTTTVPKPPAVISPSHAFFLLFDPDLYPVLRNSGGGATCKSLLNIGTDFAI